MRKGMLCALFLSMIAASLPVYGEMEETIFEELSDGEAASGEVEPWGTEPAETEPGEIKAEEAELYDGQSRTSALEETELSDGMDLEMASMDGTEMTEVMTYRIYNPETGEHLYTQDLNEKLVLTTQFGWNDEGIEWTTPSEGTQPVVRLLNPFPGQYEHHYTMDLNEVAVLVSQGWIHEGVAWYSDPDRCFPVYRLFNIQNKSYASHHYTLDANEVQVLTSRYGWVLEGTAWYSMKEAPERTVTPSSLEESDLTDGRLADLMVQVQAELPIDNGSWSVYVGNMKSGEEASVNNGRMQAASLIKLFIMGAVYENYASLVQQYGETTLMSDLTEMITVSDNDAANRLVYELGNGSDAAGRQVVNQFCENHGYLSTHMGRMLLADNTVDDNYTSAEDCGRFLREIYLAVSGGDGGTLSNSSAMFTLLSSQQRRNKIPSQMPADVRVANKTGELSDVENDAAIVTSTAKGTDLVIVFLSENLGSTGEAQTLIASISRMIYGYYNE